MGPEFSDLSQKFPSLPDGKTAASQAYLTDILTKLVNRWPASRLDELMPWATAEQAKSLAA